jgi:hypothetical protein
MSNQIPLPQTTRLFQATGNQIVQPKLSVLSLNGTCSIGSYSNLQNNSYLYQIYNQNISNFYMFFNDKNVVAWPKINNGLDGFDSGFTYAFLNITSPTIVFLPMIQATDSGQNVPLVVSGSSYLINGWQNYLNNSNLAVNNLILLTNQTTNSQNVIYRVTQINGGILTVSSVSNINSILSQNQNYIFTRALINNGVNQYYYGLNNSTGYYWVSQTQDTQLPNVDYGVTLGSDLTNLTLDINLFKNLSLTPLVNQKIAINISSGGYTSGVYVISNIIGQLIYLQPIYGPYVFIHQFTKVNLDLNSLTNAIWYVNPTQVGNTNWTYGAVQFSFSVMNPNNILGNPSLWGQQVGGIYDTTIGFLLYTNSIASNQYVLHSDTFYITVMVPSSISGASFVEGLSLDCNYSSNIIPIVEEYI